MGVDAVIPHTLLKALKFCNAERSDKRSEERRRVRMMLKMICLTYYNMYSYNLAVWSSAVPRIFVNEHRVNISCQ